MRSRLLLALTAASMMMTLGCKESPQSAKPERDEYDLGPHETAKLTKCWVRAHVDYTVRAFPDDDIDTLEICRGSLNEFWGAKLTLTRDSVFVQEYDWSDELQCSTVLMRNAFAHGLDLGYDFTVNIRTKEDNDRGYLTITADNGEQFKHKICWRGGGTPRVRNKSNCLMRVQMSLVRGAVDSDVWFVADSYFNEIDPERWTYYMVREGYTRNWMADHLPGGGSKELVQSFKNDLKYGQPRIAVWMMGMNDKDSDTRIDSEWLPATERFITLCQTHGVEPILCTIPIVPERNHTFKNQWVRDSGYRYIDLSEGVGSKPWGSEDMMWDEGLLSEDLVHPTRAGAKVIWKTIHGALPELDTLCRK